MSGAISVPVQVVVTSRLPDGEYETFKALAKDVSKEDIIKILKLAEESNDPKMIDYIRAVMNVSIVLNEAVIKEIKEEGTMNQAVERIFKKEMDEKKQEGRQEGRQEGVDATRLENIKNIMEGLKYTAQQAMDLLKIPKIDQTKYLHML